MRVLHVHSGNLYGGVERVLETLALEHWRCPGMRPEFAVCFPGRFRDSIRRTDCPVHDLTTVRLSRPWQIRRGRAALAALLASTRFDLVIVHSMWALVVFGPVLLRMGVPLVFWAHDAVYGRHWLQRWGRAVRPALAVGNSRFTAAGLRAFWPDTPCRVVHVPVRLDGCDASPERRWSTRNALGAQSATPVVIQVARMEPLKGHGVLIEALASLSADLDWQAWIVGGAQRDYERTYERRLRRQVRSLGIGDRVRFLGARDDVPDLLVAADLFAQPNVSPDAFGIVFVEALAAGLPVIAAASGGAPEIIDGSCGRLVPPGDVGACAAALSELLADETKRRQLGARGPARARSLCDPARQLHALHSALSDLCRTLSSTGHASARSNAL